MDGPPFIQFGEGITHVSEQLYRTISRIGRNPDAVLMLMKRILYLEMRIEETETIRKHTPKTLLEIERAAVVRALKNNGWHVGNAAKELGIPATTLSSKMTRFNIRNLRRRNVSEHNIQQKEDGT